MKLRIWYNVKTRDNAQAWVIEPSEPTSDNLIMTLLFASEVIVETPSRYMPVQRGQTPQGWVETEGAVTWDGTVAVIR